MEIKWESPSPIDKSGTKKSKFIQAGTDNPNQWFVYHEGPRHRPAPAPMNGSMWARAYRREQVNGKTVYRTYVMYKGLLEV